VSVRQGEHQGNSHVNRTAAGRWFRGPAGSPFDWSAEGATPDEAVRNLQGVAAARQAAGIQTATINVNDSENPLAKYAGCMKGDPMLEEWRKAIEEYREEIDNDPNR
jgi:hypothetical protein